MKPSAKDLERFSEWELERRGRWIEPLSSSRILNLLFFLLWVTLSGALLIFGLSRQFFLSRILSTEPYDS